jgi:predicted aconitase
MYLTTQEERILNGEQGNVKAKALKILVTLGDIFDADKLIPIESTQIAGISYKTIGDAGLAFLEDWAGEKVVVKSFMNPAGMDLEDWRKMGIKPDFAEKQLKIINALTSMGVQQSCTCTPYHVGLIPKSGSHIAWSESSAVVYANSVLGAMTNREGGPSALSAALIGKTPNYGFHQKRNRIATIEFIVNIELSDLDFSLLGYHIGEIAKNKIPVIKGLKNINTFNLKALGAGAAASGGIAMFMIPDVTPELNVISNPEKIIIERKDLEDVKSKLTTGKNPDIISLGCPHASYGEIEEIIQKVKTTKPIWICTSKTVKTKILKDIEKIPKNIKIFSDTCMVVSPLEDLGIGCIGTNSSKGAHYSQNLSKIKTILKSTEELLDDNSW